jgi:OOP family OmpA-OmpF porin
VKVDAKGCPLDSDGDGVPDYLDKCPGTPKGFKVDASGCIIEQTVILRAVNFEFNSDKLTPAARDTLDSVAAGLTGQSSLNVEIAGYTDSVGSAPYNLALSKKRAESVRSYLVSKGLSASRLVAKGYGKTKPIADNKTEEGRAENRRVEFAVLTKPLDVKVVKKGPTTASKAEAQSGEPKNVKKKATRPAPSGR